MPFFEAAHRLPAEDALDFRAEAPAPRIARALSCWPIRASPISTISIRSGSSPTSISSSCGRRACSRRRLPRHPARLEVTIADLAALRDAGWDIDLQAHLRRGGHVLGICGGYQMLGKKISDPNASRVHRHGRGLGRSTSRTVLEGDKVLVEITGETPPRRPFKGLRDAYRRTTVRPSTLEALQRQAMTAP